MINTLPQPDIAYNTEQKEDPKNKDDEKKELLLNESIRKVEEFASQAFNGDIPEDVQERISLLSQRISLSNAELISVQKDAGIEVGIARHTRGLFVTKEDRVILPDNATENEIVHEALHFISHRPETETNHARQGLRSGTNKIREDVYLDESITVLVSLMITLGIPINDRNAAHNAYLKIQEAKRKNILPIADSYLNAVDQMFLKIFAIDINNFKQDEINKRLPLLPEIARDYLSASPDELWATIDSNVKSKIWQTPTSKSLKKAVAEPTLERQALVEAFIANDAMMLEKYAFLTGKHLTYAKRFFNRIGRGKVTYVFSEETGKLADYNTGMNAAGVNIAPELFVSIDLNRNIYKTHEGRLFFEKAVQRAAFYLWQGYKIAHSTREHPIYDEDFYRIPNIQQFLSFQISDQDRIQIFQMAQGILHVAKTEDDEEVIQKMMTDQRIENVTRAFGY